VRARAQHDELEIERLVSTCETDIQRAENRKDVLDSLYQLLVGVNTWEWDDFQKQQQIPQRIALLALETASGEGTVKAEVAFAMTLCVAPNRADGNLALERKRRVSLVVPVLRRLLGKIDPTIDLFDIRTLARVPVPTGTSLPAIYLGQLHPSEIKDPALRAEFERRIRERNLKTEKISEQKQLLTWKKFLINNLGDYLIAAYSVKPDDTRDLDQILAKLTEEAKCPEVQAMVLRVKPAVQAALATRPE